MSQKPASRLKHNHVLDLDPEEIIFTNVRLHQAYSKCIRIFNPLPSKVQISILPGNPSYYKIFPETTEIAAGNNVLIEVQLKLHNPPPKPRGSKGHKSVFRIKSQLFEQRFFGLFYVWGVNPDRNISHSRAIVDLAEDVLQTEQTDTLKQPVGGSLHRGNSNCFTATTKLKKKKQPQKRRKAAATSKPAATKATEEMMHTKSSSSQEHKSELKDYLPLETKAENRHNNSAKDDDWQDYDDSSENSSDKSTTPRKKQTLNPRERSIHRHNIDLKHKVQTLRTELAVAREEAAHLRVEADLATSRARTLHELQRGTSMDEMDEQRIQALAHALADEAVYNERRSNEEKSRKVLSILKVKDVEIQTLKDREVELEQRLKRESENAHKKLTEAESILHGKNRREQELETKLRDTVHLLKKSNAELHQVKQQASHYQKQNSELIETLKTSEIVKLRAKLQDQQDQIEALIKKLHVSSSIDEQRNGDDGDNDNEVISGDKFGSKSQKLKGIIQELEAKVDRLQTRMNDQREIHGQELRNLAERLSPDDEQVAGKSHARRPKRIGRVGPMAELRAELKHTRERLKVAEVQNSKLTTSLRIAHLELQRQPQPSFHHDIFEQGSRSNRRFETNKKEEHPKQFHPPANKKIQNHDILGKFEKEKNGDDGDKNKDEVSHPDNNNTQNGRRAGKSRGIGRREEDVGSSASSKPWLTDESKISDRGLTIKALRQRLKDERQVYRIEIERLEETLRKMTRLATSSSTAASIRGRSSNSSNAKGGSGGGRHESGNGEPAPAAEIMMMKKKSSRDLEDEIQRIRGALDEQLVSNAQLRQSLVKVHEEKIEVQADCDDAIAEYKDKVKRLERKHERVKQQGEQNIKHLRETIKALGARSDLHKQLAIERADKGELRLQLSRFQGDAKRAEEREAEAEKQVMSLKRQLQKYSISAKKWDILGTVGSTPAGLERDETLARLGERIETQAKEIDKLSELLEAREAEHAGRTKALIEEMKHSSKVSDGDDIAAVVDTSLAALHRVHHQMQAAAAAGNEQDLIRVLSQQRDHFCLALHRVKLQRREALAEAKEYEKQCMSLNAKLLQSSTRATEEAAILHTKHTEEVLSYRQQLSDGAKKLEETRVAVSSAESMCDTIRNQLEEQREHHEAEALKLQKNLQQVREEVTAERRLSSKFERERDRMQALVKEKSAQIAVLMETVEALEPGCEDRGVTHENDDHRAFVKNKSSNVDKMKQKNRSSSSSSSLTTISSNAKTKVIHLAAHLSAAKAIESTLEQQVERMNESYKRQLHLVSQSQEYSDTLASKVSRLEAEREAHKKLIQKQRLEITQLRNKSSAEDAAKFQMTQKIMRLRADSDNSRRDCEDLKQQLREARDAALERLGQERKEHLRILSEIADENKFDDDQGVTNNSSWWMNILLNSATGDSSSGGVDSGNILLESNHHSYPPVLLAGDGSHHQIPSSSIPATAASAGTSSALGGPVAGPPLIELLKAINSKIDAIVSSEPLLLSPLATRKAAAGSSSSSLAQNAKRGFRKTRRGGGGSHASTTSSSTSKKKSVMKNKSMSCLLYIPEVVEEMTQIILRNESAVTRCERRTRRLRWICQLQQQKIRRDEAEMDVLRDRWRQCRNEGRRANQLLEDMKEIYSKQLMHERRRGEQRVAELLTTNEHVDKARMAAMLEAAAAEKELQQYRGECEKLRRQVGIMELEHESDETKRKAIVEAELLQKLNTRDAAIKTYIEQTMQKTLLTARSDNAIEDGVTKKGGGSGENSTHDAKDSVQPSFSVKTLAKNLADEIATLNIVKAELLDKASTLQKELESSRKGEEVRAVLLARSEKRIKDLEKQLVDAKQRIKADVFTNERLNARNAREYDEALEKYKAEAQRLEFELKLASREVITLKADKRALLSENKGLQSQLASTNTQVRRTEHKHEKAMRDMKHRYAKQLGSIQNRGIKNFAATTTSRRGINGSEEEEENVEIDFEADSSPDSATYRLRLESEVIKLTKSLHKAEMRSRSQTEEIEKKQEAINELQHVIAHMDRETLRILEDKGRRSLRMKPPPSSNNINENSGLLAQHLANAKLAQADSARKARVCAQGEAEARTKLAQLEQELRILRRNKIVGNTKGGGGGGGGGGVETLSKGRRKRTTTSATVTASRQQFKDRSNSAIESLNIRQDLVRKEIEIGDLRRQLAVSIAMKSRAAATAQQPPASSNAATAAAAAAERQLVALKKQLQEKDEKQNILRVEMKRLLKREKSLKKCVSQLSSMIGLPTPKRAPMAPPSTERRNEGGGRRRSGTTPRRGTTRSQNTVGDVYDDYDVGVDAKLRTSDDETGGGLADVIIRLTQQVMMKALQVEKLKKKLSHHQSASFSSSRLPHPSPLGTRGLNANDLNSSGNQDESQNEEAADDDNDYSLAPSAASTSSSSQNEVIRDLSHKLEKAERELQEAQEANIKLSIQQPKRAWGDDDDDDNDIQAQMSTSASSMILKIRDVVADVNKQIGIVIVAASSSNVFTSPGPHVPATTAPKKIHLRSSVRMDTKKRKKATAGPTARAAKLITNFISKMEKASQEITTAGESIERMLLIANGSKANSTQGMATTTSKSSSVSSSHIRSLTDQLRKNREENRALQMQLDTAKKRLDQRKVEVSSLRAQLNATKDLKHRTDQLGVSVNRRSSIMRKQQKQQPTAELLEWKRKCLVVERKLDKQSKDINRYKAAIREWKAKVEGVNEALKAIKRVDEMPSSARTNSPHKSPQPPAGPHPQQQQDGPMLRAEKEKNKWYQGKIANLEQEVATLHAKALESSLKKLLEEPSIAAEYDGNGGEEKGKAGIVVAHEVHQTQQQRKNGDALLSSAKEPNHHSIRRQSNNMKSFDGGGEVDDDQSSSHWESSVIKTAQIFKLEGRISSLETQVSSLRAQLSNRERALGVERETRKNERQVHIREIEAHKVEIAQLREQVKTAQKVQDDLERRRKEAAEALAVVEGKLENECKENERLSRQLVELKDVQQQQVAVKKEAFETVERAEASLLAQSQRQAAMFEKMMADMQRRHDLALKSEREEIQKQKRVLEDTHRREKERAEMKHKEEIVEATRDLEHKYNKDLETQLEKERSVLNRERVLLDQKLQNIAAQYIKEIKDSREDFDRLKHEFQGYKNTQDSLSERHSVECATLRRKLKDLSNNEELLFGAGLTVERKPGKLTKAATGGGASNINDSVNNSTKDKNYAARRKALASNLVQMTSEIAKQQGKLAAIKLTMKKLKSRNKRLENALRIATEQNEKNRSMHGSANSSPAAAAAVVAAVTADATEMAFSSSKEYRQSSVLEARNASLQTKISDLEKQLKFSAGRVEELEETIKKHSTANTQLKANWEEARENASAVTKQMQVLEEKHAKQLEKLHSALRNEADWEAMENAVKDSKAAARQARDEISKRVSAVRSLKLEVKRTASKAARAEREHQACKLKLQKANKLLAIREKLVQTLRQRLNAAVNMDQENAQARINLQAKAQSTTARLLRSRQTIASLRDKLATAEKEMESKQVDVTKVYQLELRITQLRNDNKRTRTLYDRTKQKLVDMEADLAKFRSKAESLESMLLSARVDLRKQKDLTSAKLREKDKAHANSLRKEIADGILGLLSFMSRSVCDLLDHLSQGLKDVKEKKKIQRQQRHQQQKENGGDGNNSLASEMSVIATKMNFSESELSDILRASAVAEEDVKEALIRNATQSSSSYGIGFSSSSSSDAVLNNILKVLEKPELLSSKSTMIQTLQTTFDRLFEEQQQLVKKLVTAAIENNAQQEEEQKPQDFPKGTRRLLHTTADSNNEHYSRDKRFEKYEKAIMRIKEQIIQQRGQFQAEKGKYLNQITQLKELLKDFTNSRKERNNRSTNQG